MHLNGEREVGQMTTRRRGGGDTVREVSPLQARLSQKDPAGSEGGRNMYKV